MRDFIKRGVGGISVELSDATAMARFSDQAIEARISVVTFDSDSPASATGGTEREVEKVGDDVSHFIADSSSEIVRLPSCGL